MKKLVPIILLVAAFLSLILTSFVLAQQEQQFTLNDTKGKFTKNPVIINSDTIPKSIEKGKNLLVNITMVNQDRRIVRDLNTDVVSTGFKTLNKNPLINEIFPNSTIHGQYLLEATSIGKHTLYLNSLYTIISTEKSNLSLPIQVSNISDIGTIDVIERPFYAIDWLSLSPGLISSLVGLAAGAGLTKLVERSKEKEMETKEKLQVRRLLLDDLKILEKVLEDKQELDSSHFEIYSVLTANLRMNEYLEDNEELKDSVLRFYTELREALNLQKSSREILSSRRKELIGQIQKIRNLVKKWSIQS